LSVADIGFTALCYKQSISLCPRPVQHGLLEKYPGCDILPACQLPDPWNMNKLLKVLLILVVTLTLFGALFIWFIGAWNILFPSSSHDKTAPALPSELSRPAVLLFSKTNSFRHKEGIPAGNRVISSLAKDLGLSVFATENGAVFNNDDLSRFDVVVFQSATGDMLSEPQEQALQDWLEAGGGWLGTHAAGDSSHLGWQWYSDNLIGAEFTAHIMGPQFQTASVVMEAPEHPANRDIKPVWEHEEEWYSWAESPRARGFNILATIDEDSYTPVQKMFNSERDLRMEDHPVVWSNCVGKGRTLYSTMGHKAEAFDQPQHRQLLKNALAWLARQTDGGC
jgi:type 1 glutamine amidotransferase